MKRFFLFMTILLIPVSSLAAYKVYLSNGSVISDVTSYDEVGDKVDIYFSTGYMSVPKKDVLKIEGTESPRKESATEEEGSVTQPERRPEVPQETAVPPTPSAPADDKGARVSELKAEWDSINAEIKSAEEQEAKLVSEINEKTGNSMYQVDQLEKELEPLRQDLNTVQQKKADLAKRMSEIENELRSLE